MTRKIKEREAWVDFVNVPDEIVAWLQSQAAGYQWLLAHAEDGVIWGRVENRMLITQYEAGFEPALDAETLLQARLFGENAELFVWRDGNDSWHTRIITDKTIADREPDFKLAIDENQILWGDKPVQHQEGFTLMQDGEQGLQHAVPLEVSNNGDRISRPLRLIVRHYVSEDKNGNCRIVASRLVKVSISGS